MTQPKDQSYNERGDEEERISPFDDPKIGYSSLGNQVYELLWKRIVNQQLHPGEKISDLHLSKDLGVSRTPVREALYRLVQDGIVEVKSQRGFFLSTFSSQDVNEVYDLRTALEMLAVRLALPKLAEADLAKSQNDLDEVYRLLEQDESKAREVFLRIDREFHQMLRQVAKNRRLSSALDSLQAQIGVFQVYGNHFQGIFNLSVAHHQEILNALKQRDEAAAMRAMERHIQEVKAGVLHNISSLTDLEQQAG